MSPGDTMLFWIGAIFCLITLFGPVGRLILIALRWFFEGLFLGLGARVSGVFSSEMRSSRRRQDR